MSYTLYNVYIEKIQDTLIFVCILYIQLHCNLARSAPHNLECKSNVDCLYQQSISCRPILSLDQSKAKQSVPNS